MLTVKRSRKAAKPLSLVVMSKGRAIAPSRGATTQRRQPLKQVAPGFILQTSLPGKVNRVINQPNDVLPRGGFTAQAAPTPTQRLSQKRPRSNGSVKSNLSHLQVIKQRNEGDHVVKSLLNKLMQRPSGQERAVQSQYEDLRIKPMIATHFQRRVNGNVHKQIPGPVSKTNSRKKRMSGRSAAKPVCRSHALILHAPQLMAPNSPQNG